MSRGRKVRAYAGLASRIVAGRLGSRHPFKATWVLTDRCDCRCRGCLIWQKPKGRELTPDEIGAALAEATFLRWVNLTGGEICLRNDLPEVVEAVCRALPGLAVLDFPTTGQRTTRILEDVARIAAFGVPQLLVTVSVEGPPALHDRMRGRDEAFRRMVETYAGLRRIDGVDVYLGMTLTAENEHLVEETMRAVDDALPADAGTIGWRDLHLNVYTTSAHYYANLDSDVRPPRALHDAVDKARRVREASASPTDRIEATYLRLLPAYLASGRSPLPCRALRASLFVAANGDVHPCSVYERRLGNVLESTIPKILETTEAEAARDVVARDACPGCWSPCEANPTIVATAPGSLLRGRADVRR